MSTLGFGLALLFVGSTLALWWVLRVSPQVGDQYKQAYASKTQDTLSKLFVFVDGKRVFRLNVAAFVLVPALVYFLSSNVALAIIAAVAVYAAPRIAFRVMAKRRLEAIELALPDALAQIAGAMRAGSTLAIAMENMVRETKGPIGQEFGMVLKEQRIGVPIEQAMENLATRVQSENVDLVVAAALVAKDVGGNLAESFERLSSTLREKIAMEGKIKALTAQGKLQGWVVGLLPVGMILVLSQMERQAVNAMFSSLAGWIWLGIISLLLLLGMLFIRKIVNIDV